MSVHHFGKRDAPQPQKRSTRLEQRIPAFRADDAVLGQLWRSIEAKCGEAGPPSSSLTVYETVRAAGRGTKERHTYEYQSIDDLRRSSNEPARLREYTLSVSSPWGDDYRRVHFRASGFGAASVEISAPDADWCHDVLETVLRLFRPHTAWYAIVHRVGLYGTLCACLGMAAVAIWANIREYPIGFREIAVYGVSLGVIAALEFLRDRIFPAAEIRVARHDRNGPTHSTGHPRLTDSPSGPAPSE